MNRKNKLPNNGRMEANMSKKNCIVAQSGGPTVAINASLAGVIHGVTESEQFEVIYGAVHGVQGLINEEIINLSEKNENEFGFIDLLRKSPSMYLGSCRYQMKDFAEDDSDYKKVFEIFEKYDIGAFFYIGGNDSMDTVDKLSKFAEKIGSDVKVVGVPKTIDNDLCVTDHTPGYGSAAKFVATTLLETAFDTAIYPIKSVTIVEIMGRDAGWLAGSSVLARNKYSDAPHLVYLPEVAFNEVEFIEDVKAALEKYDNIVIAVSEGIKNADGQYISATTAVADTFGHSQLSGTAKCLEHIIKQNIKVKVRAIEINTLQRSAAHILSETDNGEAFMLGRTAVKYAAEGRTGIMVILKRLDADYYSVAVDATPVSNVAGLVKHVPREWINERGNDVTQEFYDYVNPLILGEVEPKFKNGLPVYMDISHLYPNK